jgi:serine/threonine-protein kinase ULK2
MMNSNYEKSMDNIKYKYKITTKKAVGKGAFSIVYKAENKNKEIFAIKCISLDKLKKHNLDKFLFELDISMKMRHNNIVKCHEVFKTNKNWYIVTEFCNGGTLQDSMKDLPSNYKDREIICKKYLTQLKNSLKYLHRNNIVHRDLKPSNILLSGKYPNDTLKLADFGFSRYFNSNESAEGIIEENMMTSFCGTPMYMAPELLSDRKYTSKADLWSFGVIMYELLYGTNPYNYPTNIHNLLELMQTQEINYIPIYSQECISLLQSLLEINHQKRISWDDFIKHEWFDKTIPSGFSRDSLYGSNENIISLGEKSPDKKIATPKFKYNKFPNSNSNADMNISNYDMNTNHKVSHDEISENNIQKCKDDDDDFDVIDINDLGPCDYNSYKEEETMGLLQILSRSVYSMFSKK